jgi:DNA polymerase
MAHRPPAAGDGGTAAPLVPAHLTLPALRAAAAGCRACPLWERGTQTVFGAGPPLAEVMLVGEQPGNEEDLAGAPFVGPPDGSSIAPWRRRASTDAGST